MAFVAGVAGVAGVAKALASPGSLCMSMAGWYIVQRAPPSTSRDWVAHYCRWSDQCTEKSYLR